MKSKTQSHTNPSFAIGPFIWFAGCSGLKSDFPGGTTYTIRRLVVGAMLVLWAANGFADELFFDDFSSGNSSRSVWQEFPGGGTMDATSGDYVFTQPDGQTSMFSVLTGVPAILNLTDTSIRTQVSLDGSSTGISMFSRATFGSPNTTYQGGYNPNSGTLYLGWNHPGYDRFTSVPFDYDLSAQDLILQFDVIGNVLSLWAWPPGERRPLEPQVTYTDTIANLASGAPGFLNDPVSPGIESIATFRYIQVADTSIPDAPWLSINKGETAAEADLSWTPTLDSYVPLESSSLTGAWTPMRVPILMVNGRNQISVPTSETQQFFQLALGQQFTDEFTGGMKGGWETIFLGKPAWSSYVTIEATNNQFRVIVAPQPEYMGDQGSIPYVRLIRQDVPLQNVSMSMDILAWDHSKRPTCALVAQRRASGGGSFAAIGLGFHARSDFSQAGLWSWTSLGVNGGPLFTINPTHQYRLVLTAVDGSIDGELFDMSDLTTPVSTHGVFDASLISGPVGMYFGDDRSGPQGGFDITVDNFQATGTQPFQPVMITTQPQSQGVEPGGAVTFSVEAVGEGELRYQWRKDDTEISEATKDMVTIASAQISDEGDYTVMVRDDFSSVTSEPARLTLLVPPVIVSHPQSQTVNAGETVTFSVTVTNTATLPIWYRWRRNSTTLTNEMINGRTATYTITNVQAMDAGNYTVIVTNAAFHMPGFGSDDAVLEVLPSK